MHGGSMGQEWRCAAPGATAPALGARVPHWMGSWERDSQGRLDGVRAGQRHCSRPRSTWVPRHCPLFSIRQGHTPSGARSATWRTCSRCSQLHWTGASGYLAARPPSMRPTSLNSSRSRWALRSAPGGHHGQRSAGELYGCVVPACAHRGVTASAVHGVVQTGHGTIGGDVAGRA